MQSLYDYMYTKIKALNTDYVRYMDGRIKWENKMLGLVGPRGVGKTTLFLQHMVNSGHLEESLYVTADNLYFADHTLYETAEAFYKEGGLFLYVDEIHRYKNWSQELKNIYDAFPDLTVYFTGSSILDITRGAYDLSRRAPQYFMQGLSFREWLGMKRGIMFEPLTLDQVLTEQVEIPGVAHPLPLFKEYLKCGYYPFGDEVDFPVKLEQAVGATLDVDIPQFADMRAPTSRKLKKLMVAVSDMAPFKPNMTQLASMVQTTRNSLEDYLELMDKAGLIARLETTDKELKRIAKPEKVYLDNSNLAYALSEDVPNIGTVRETFFFNQLRLDHKVFASPVSDFLVDGKTFEIGGSSKGVTQIKGVDDGFLAKDDIEYKYKNSIPLWTFGLLY